ncbi:hypothetical protein CHISP_1714 [Chitinispirillum alkaliphilum]|nr:hypothetical protein CHISP_1714 [Chitinispirillum alkaliphilum]
MADDIQINDGFTYGGRFKMVFNNRITMRYFAGFSIFAIILFLCSCDAAREEHSVSLIEDHTNLYREIVTEDSVSICWHCDPALEGSVNHFELYYQPKSGNEPVVLESYIPFSSTPCAMIRRADLKHIDSAYYFAVRAVGFDGVRSDFHFSSDSKANLEGWYIIWKNNYR